MRHLGHPTKYHHAYTDELYHRVRNYLICIWRRAISISRFGDSDNCNLWDPCSNQS